MIEVIPAVEVRHCDQDPAHGNRPAETVEFGLDGRNYLTELCNKDRKDFDKMIAPYLAVARKVTSAASTATPKTKRRTQAMRNRAAAIRAWAIETGRLSSDHGRIPEHVKHEYDAEHAN